MWNPSFRASASQTQLFCLWNDSLTFTAPLCSLWAFIQPTHPIWGRLPHLFLFFCFFYPYWVCSTGSAERRMARVFRIAHCPLTRKLVTSLVRTWLVAFGNSSHYTHSHTHTHTHTHTQTQLAACKPSTQSADTTHLLRCFCCLNRVD